MGDSERPGLRENLLEKRLTDLVVGGAGDAEKSRRKGLDDGTVDEGREVRGGAEDLRNGFAEEGLEWKPTSKSLVLVLMFHRGRLFNGDGVGRNDDLRDAGVGVGAAETGCFAGDGAISVGFGIADFLLPVVAEGVGCGTPEKRRTLDMVVLAALPTELPR